MNDTIGRRRDTPGKLPAWSAMTGGERARVCEQRHQYSLNAAGVSRTANA